MTREDVMKVQEQFSLTGQPKTIGTLQGTIVIKILLGTGPTKKFISKQYYLRNKSLHVLPKFISKAKVIQVGSGAKCQHFVHPSNFITIQGYMFEIYIMVSEIPDFVGLLLGIKTFAE